jgi:hypothetical protein
MDDAHALSAPPGAFVSRLSGAKQSRLRMAIFAQRPKKTNHPQLRESAGVTASVLRHFLGESGAAIVTWCSLMARALKNRGVSDIRSSESMAIFAHPEGAVATTPNVFEPPKTDSAQLRLVQSAS